MAEFEGLDPNSERDEIRDIISALSQGNAGEEKLEKDISSIKKNVDVIVSNTMSGPSKEEREENARQEKNNARFLADLLAQKLAGIFGEQLKKLKEIAENTKKITEEDGFKLTRGVAVWAHSQRVQPSLIVLVGKLERQRQSKTVVSFVRLLSKVSKTH